MSLGKQYHSRERNTKQDDTEVQCMWWTECRMGRVKEMLPTHTTDPRRLLLQGHGTVKHELELLGRARLSHVMLAPWTLCFTAVPDIRVTTSPPCADLRH